MRWPPPSISALMYFYRSHHALRVHRLPSQQRATLTPVTARAEKVCGVVSRAGSNSKATTFSRKTSTTIPTNAIHSLIVRSTKDKILAFLPFLFFCRECLHCQTSWFVKVSRHQLGSLFCAASRMRASGLAAAFCKGGSARWVSQRF